MIYQIVECVGLVSALLLLHRKVSDSFRKHGILRIFELHDKLATWNCNCLLFEIIIIDKVILSVIATAGL